ncbi:Protein kinase C and casein kinase substrate in neurons protein 2 [Eumeta japonica]|uniref:Protein kinase C and casein kinase substrate in neurons protein 2 n=1 Tax=Eumeta variegata TaxID=151549 RepID=A0A4C1VP68_EUMVA|nr:Protein kinase C and casein kinase substrate in neurons protein 2 [Eumeta japonica]
MKIRHERKVRNPFFFRLPQIYEEFYHTVNNADHQKDLKWWANNHGVNMAMAWPQFEVCVRRAPLGPITIFALARLGRRVFAQLSSKASRDPLLMYLRAIRLIALCVLSAKPEPAETSAHRKYVPESAVTALDRALDAARLLRPPSAAALAARLRRALPKRCWGRGAANTKVTPSYGASDRGADGAPFSLALTLSRPVWRVVLTWPWPGPPPAAQEYTEEFRDIAKGKSKESLPTGPITLLHQRPVGEDTVRCTQTLKHAFVRHVTLRRHMHTLFNQVENDR